jgi:DNA-binding CsgD family transcriptional regulator
MAKTLEPPHTVPDAHAAASFAELRDERLRLTAALSMPRRASASVIAKHLRELSEVDRAIWDLEAKTQQAQLEALVLIHESLSRLQLCSTPAELIEAAPLEMRRSCGFSRAMISRVRGSQWVPYVLNIADDQDPEVSARFHDFVMSTEIPLAHMLLETEMVRRRIPALVTDTKEHPGMFRAIVEASRSTSYVAAPVMPTRRVIGFLHADRFGQSKVPDTTDRDNLWTFAEHFGLMFERAVLVERLERQRAALGTAFASAAAQIDAMCTDELALARNEIPEPQAAAEDQSPARPGLSAILTSREREVLELMAAGYTNTRIGQELVVSEGTVKSHVKRILRKLHVSNRAEAVARYLHFVKRDHTS